MALENGVNQNISLYNVDNEGASASSFTFLDGAGEIFMEWSPDSKFLAFSAVIDSMPGIYLKKADNTGQITPLYRSKSNPCITDWSHDGKYIMFIQDNNIYVYSFADSTARLYLDIEEELSSAKISPNMHVLKRIKLFLVQNMI